MSNWQKFFYFLLPFILLVLLVGVLFWQRINTLKPGHFRLQSENPPTFTYQDKAIVIKDVILPFSGNCEGTFNFVLEENGSKKSFYGRKGLEKYKEMISGGTCLMSPDSCHLLVFRENFFYLISPLDRPGKEIPRLRVIALSLPNLSN